MGNIIRSYVVDSPNGRGNIAALGNSAKLLATGQVTSYGSGTGVDDGALMKGIAKSYTILTTGQYSGTTPVTMVHYTSAAGAVTFNNTLHTIVDSGNGLATFKTNDVILTNSASNPGPFTVTTGNVAGTITCTGATFVDETPAGAIAISKYINATNACVVDNNTGLMWRRVASTNFGPASDGLMAWTTDANGVGIFPYAARVNVAAVAGYSDWRIPNINEIISIMDFQAPTSFPDSTAWPSLPVTLITSTTRSGSTTSANDVNFTSGLATSVVKTAVTDSVLLVRG